MELLHLLVLSLATWRLSSLLARESGPGEIFLKLRYKAGVRYSPKPPFDPYGINGFAKGLICVWCNSVWIGIGLAIAYYVNPVTVIIATPLALSAIAILFDEHVNLK